MIARERVNEQEKWFFYRGEPLPVLYRKYLDYLRSVKGLTVSTIHNRKKPVLLFLMKMKRFSEPKTIQNLRPAQVHDYMIETAQPLSRDGKRALIVALRDFFKFLHLNDYTRKDLSKSVPTIVTYRLTSLHRGLPWKTIRMLIQSADRRTHAGRRDYAILLMLARYGVRQGQLVSLELDDIDWHKQTILFKAVKGGRDVLSPLFPEVARALIAYFKGGRMEAPKKHKQVFLTTGTYGSQVDGQRPIPDLWPMVSRRLKVLGVNKTCPFPRGPHAIRHAFATRLLEKNESLKTISELLGHRLLGTTCIYTKSDMKRLRRLAVEWPERSAA
jgi:site-specific recombinase XerD